jgi:hypothetical protein
MLAVNGNVWQAHAGKVSSPSVPSGVHGPGVVNSSGCQLLLLTSSSHLPVQKHQSSSLGLTAYCGVGLRFLEHVYCAFFARRA